MDVPKLLKDLRDRIKLANRLEKQRKSLAARLEKIERRLGAITAAAMPQAKSPSRTRRAKRPRNKIRLSDAIAKVLSKDKPNAVAQI